MQWIWQHLNWPFFTWQTADILEPLSQARLQQGKLLGQMSNIGFEISLEASADVLAEEALKTAEIEGERFDKASVRSSVAKQLGLTAADYSPPDRFIDGLVSILIDATQHYKSPLTAERLKSWQAALFPTGYSGLLRVHVGDWRDEPMQVVSGKMGRETLHFEAVPMLQVQSEMEAFLNWWSSPVEDGLLRAAIAHFYFVTIHPFEDGNGRLARVLTDMALAQDENTPRRFYSFSSQIMKERAHYYAVLERCQRGDGDITAWMVWFLGCYTRAVEQASAVLLRSIDKAAFWQCFSQTTLSTRQRKVINLLLGAGKGGFLGGLTTRKYVSIAKVSRATAFREIVDLLDKKILLQNSGKGRSISYDINWPHSDVSL